MLLDLSKDLKKLDGELYLISDETGEFAGPSFPFIPQIQVTVCS